MRFFLDLTAPEHIVLGFRRRGETEICIVTTPPRTHENVIVEIDRFLRRFRLRPSSISELVVVAGPGKFSDLRVAATIANAFAFAEHTRLSAVRRSVIPPEEGRAYLDDLDERKRRVQTVRPMYGKPAAITRPKKRPHR